MPFHRKEVLVAPDFACSKQGMLLLESFFKYAIMLGNANEQHSKLFAVIKIQAIRLAQSSNSWVSAFANGGYRLRSWFGQQFNTEMHGSWMWPSDFSVMF